MGENGPSVGNLPSLSLYGMEENGSQEHFGTTPHVTPGADGTNHRHPDYSRHPNIASRHPNFAPLPSPASAVTLGLNHGLPPFGTGLVGFHSPANWPFSPHIPGEPGSQSTILPRVSVSPRPARYPSHSPASQSTIYPPDSVSLNLPCNPSLSTLRHEDSISQSMLPTIELPPIRVIGDESAQYRTSSQLAISPGGLLASGELEPRSTDGFGHSKSPSTVVVGDSHQPSSQVSQNKPKKRRKRRTREEIDAENAKKGKKKKSTGGRSISSATSSLSSKSSAQSSSTGDLESTANAPAAQFELRDFENICLYLEDSDHYAELFGSGSETSIGGGPKISKVKAWCFFADFMNETNERLQLTGRRLQQRFGTYKEKYRKAKDWENNTGAGVLENDGYDTLAQKLEAMCPCYERMNDLFGTKPNITPMCTFDSGNGIDINALALSEEDEDGVGNDVEDTEASTPRNTNLDEPLEESERWQTPRAHRSERLSDMDHGSAEEAALADIESGEGSHGSSQLSSREPSLAPPMNRQGPDRRSPSHEENDATGSTTRVTPAKRSTIPNAFRTPLPSASFRSGSSRSASMKSSSLAGAYEQANQGRIDLLQWQLELDFKRFDLELTHQQDQHNEREKDRDLRERQHAHMVQSEETARLEARQAREAEAERRHEEQQRLSDLQQQKMKAVKSWLEEGKTALEIEILTRAIFG